MLLGDEDDIYKDIIIIKPHIKKKTLKNRLALNLFFSQTRLLLSQPLSYDALVARVKCAVEMLGLAKEDYSGHSLLAGGATDLFVARKLYYVIKKMGRWLTDSAMIYYRHEEDVVVAVHRAFRRVADSTARLKYLSGSET